MQEVTRDTIISLAAFAAVFGMVYVFLMTRHRERMTMLDRNILTNPFRQPKQYYGLTSLKYGMLLTGFGIGYFTSFIMFDYFNVPHAIAIISMPCLFGGISLILYYLIVKNKGFKEE